MPKLRINDIEMYYELHGKGHPLVLISGFTGSHLVWEEGLDYLTPHFQVLLFDNRGIGQTDIPDTPYTIDMMANDTIGLIRALNLKKPHVLGVSMGGAIVQRLAYKYQNEISKLIIANSFSKLNFPIALAFENVVPLYEGGASREDIFKHIISLAFSDIYLRKNDNYNKLLRKVKVDPFFQTEVGYKHQLEALVSFDSTLFLGQIKQKKLVIIADKDIIVLLDESRKFKRQMPNSTLFTMHNTGHASFLERPKEFFEKVCQFLLSD